jgi:hypothetical protein
MAVVPLRVSRVLHRARRSDVPGVARVIGVTRVICDSSVAGVSGVALRRRRVIGVRAVSPVFRRSFGLRVDRRPMLSLFVLGIVAHVVTLPNFRAYALFSSRTSSGRSMMRHASQRGGRRPTRVTLMSRRTAAFERRLPAPAGA